MEASEILRGLGQSVIEYDTEATANWARQAVEAKLDPELALNALTEAIREVGDGFESGELWLPDLIAAADAMSAGTAVLEKEIEARGVTRQGLGVVVVGTVFGDIHDIGKNMVATLLRASGFTVHDLGVNITATQFVDAIARYKADALALSALLSTTAGEQRKVIEQLKEAGLRGRLKIMVGGGGITNAFAESIGADGYAATAPGAVALTRRLLAVQEV